MQTAIVRGSTYDSSGHDGLVARFAAKSPSWLPKGWNASFF